MSGEEQRVRLEPQPRKCTHLQSDEAELDSKGQALVLFEDLELVEQRRPGSEGKAIRLWGGRGRRSERTWFSFAMMTEGSTMGSVHLQSERERKGGKNGREGGQLKRWSAGAPAAQQKEEPSEWRSDVQGTSGGALGNGVLARLDGLSVDMTVPEKQRRERLKLRLRTLKTKRTAQRPGSRRTRPGH